MRTHALKHFQSLIFTGFVCLAAAMVLSSCSKKPQQEIIGKWNVQGQPVMVEFRKDGTVMTTTSGKETSATYKFLTDTNMEMETSTMSGTNKLLVRVSVTVAVQGDTADVTMEVPQRAGEPPTPHTLHLQRAK